MKLIGTHDEPLRVERFMESWEYNDQGCAEWTQGYASNGYGIFTWDYAPARRQISAHVAAYLLFKGEIPAGQEVRHTCDNRRCVAPAHLILGTRADNVRDALERGGYRGWGMKAKLSFETAREIRSLYATGDYSQRQLASKYGVSQPSIGNIIRGKTWKEPVAA